MDLFSGSGTTAAVASRLGRRFVAVDASPFALYTLRARLLQNASAPSLLEGERELRLAYPSDNTPASFSCGFTQRHGRRMLLIDRAEFEPAAPLIYAALGTTENGRFLPVSTDCRPALPVLFPLDGVAAPVVQFADALGHQAFFTVD